MLFSFQRPTFEPFTDGEFERIFPFDTPPAKAAEFTQIRFTVKREISKISAAGGGPAPSNLPPVSPQLSLRAEEIAKLVSGEQDKSDIPRKSPLIERERARQPPGITAEKLSVAAQRSGRLERDFPEVRGPMPDDRGL